MRHWPPSSTRFSPVAGRWQAGGRPVIAKFLRTFLDPVDEALYPNPGFPIYESLIRFHGGVAVPYGIVRAEKNHTFDIDGIEQSITERSIILYTLSKKFAMTGW